MKGDTKHIVIKMSKLNMEDKEPKATPSNAPWQDWINYAKGNKLDVIESQDP
jgi:hypothetical protein